MYFEDSHFNWDEQIGFVLKLLNLKQLQWKPFYLTLVSRLEQSLQTEWEIVSVSKCIFQQETTMKQQAENMLLLLLTVKDPDKMQEK